VEFFKKFTQEMKEQKHGCNMNVNVHAYVKSIPEYIYMSFQEKN